MADSFQIPQRNPQYVAPIAPPTDMIHELYNRPKPGEIAAGQMSDAVKAIYDRYIQMQQLKASAFGEGGPALYNMLGYGRSAATTPPGAVAGQQPPPPTTAQATPPGAVAGQVPQPQGGGAMSQDQYHAIAGQLGVQPDFGGYQKQIGDLTGQMQQSAQNYGPSRFGKANQEMLGGQLNALKTGMEAQKAPLEFQKTANEVSLYPLNVEEKNASIRASNAKFATPEQGAAIAEGNPEAIAGSYGGQAPIDAYNNAAAKMMERNKTAASEISKQGPLTTEVKTLNGMFDNVDKNLHAYYSQKHMLGSANVYKGTKGRAGSAEGATVLNQSAPLVAAINKSLTSRFNMGENELLSSTIAPSPNDTPQYAASKMKMLHQLIAAMDQGNRENVSNVIAAMSGNVPDQVKANGR